MDLKKEQTVWQQIFSEAENNLNFRKELIAAPMEAIERLTGKKIKLPKGKGLKIMEQSDENFVYVTLPNIKDLDLELTEDELEQAAGGSSQTHGCGLPTWIDTSPR